jgi:hypothetical protein
LEKAAAEAMGRKERRALVKSGKGKLATAVRYSHFSELLRDPTNELVAQEHSRQVEAAAPKPFKNKPTGSFSWHNISETLHCLLRCITT